MATATKPTRFQDIARMGAEFFEAIKEHAKISPAESAALYDAAAAHVRSAAPQSMVKPQPPLSAVKVPIGPDGWYGVTVVGAGVVLVVNEGSRDAALTLTPVQAEALCRDVMAVKAGVEAAGG